MLEIRKKKKEEANQERMYRMERDNNKKKNAGSLHYRLMKMAPKPQITHLESPKLFENKGAISATEVWISHA